MWEFQKMTFVNSSEKHAQWDITLSRFEKDFRSHCTVCAHIRIICWSALFCLSALRENAEVRWCLRPWKQGTFSPEWDLAGGRNCGMGMGEGGEGR